MEPMYLSIRQKETGSHIKKLLMENGYTVRDIQNAMGFENPQAIYKWISGRSLPSIDNFVILSRLLHTSIEDILVIDEDIVRFVGIFNFIVPTVTISTPEQHQCELHHSPKCLLRYWLSECIWNLE